MDPCESPLDDVCLVCHDELGAAPFVKPPAGAAAQVEVEGEVARLACGHAFHARCILVAVLSSSCTCPACNTSRAPVGGALLDGADRAEWLAERRRLATTYAVVRARVTRTTGGAIKRETEAVAREKALHERTAAAVFGRELKEMRARVARALGSHLGRYFALLERGQRLVEDQKRAELAAGHAMGGAYANAVAARQGPRMFAPFRPLWSLRELPRRWARSAPEVPLLPARGRDKKVDAAAAPRAEARGDPDVAAKAEPEVGRKRRRVEEAAGEE